MKILYDSQNDLLYIELSEAQATRSEDNRGTGGGYTTPLRVVDYDEKGDVVGLEFLDVSQQLCAPADIWDLAHTFHLDAATLERELATAGFHVSRRRIAGTNA